MPGRSGADYDDGAMTTVPDKSAKDREPQPGDTVPAGATPGPIAPASIVTARGQLARLGRYEALDELGRGGMGVVYRGHDPGLDRVVALKTLSPALAADPGFRARFTSEARALARIEHPNVVHVYDVGEDDGTPFFAMELVQGRSVEVLVRERGPLSIAEAVDVVKQAASGLHAAHAHGIVHRDIKPSNLVVDGDHRVKVLDFGLAKMLGEGPKTATDVVMGTPEYMSPEQARGETPDHRSDIYALGATFYFLLAGAPPFTGESPLSVIHKQVHEAPPSIAARRQDVPPAVAALLDRLLSKDPAGRPRDHAALIAELNALSLTPVAPWPPALVRWQALAVALPMRAAEQALASRGATDWGLARLHVLNVALLNAAVVLLVTRMGGRALHQFASVWISLGLSALVAAGAAQATGQPSAYLRHFVAESAASGHILFFSLMCSRWRVLWAPIAMVTLVRGRLRLHSAVGLQSFAARLAVMTLTILIHLTLLWPR